MISEGLHKEVGHFDIKVKYVLMLVLLWHASNDTVVATGSTNTKNTCKQEVKKEIRM